MKTLDRNQLISRIREKGVEIENIDELKRIGRKDSDLVPILLEFLDLVEDENDKEFLVRCLGVKGFYEATGQLLREFYNTEKTTYKWAIGNSLAIISDESQLNEMLKIALEKKHGIARQMIVEGLGSFRTDEVKHTLINLLKDDEVVGHAINALSKIGDGSTKCHIEPFVTYKVAWVRKAAIRALKKLDKKMQL